MAQKILRLILPLFIAALMVCTALPVQAKVSSEEAKRLEKELTPFGAERAGNTDGTIPAWTPMTGIPDNIHYDPNSDARHPDPFADDKILFTITAQNLDTYKDKMSPGIIEIFKQYPDTWKINVYPSRRPAAAPQEVYDNIYLNALESELIGDGSDGFKGAFGGIPFPIPQNGAEAIWNNQPRWKGPSYTDTFDVLQVYPNGEVVSGGVSKNYFYFKSYEGTRKDYNSSDFLGYIFMEYIEPVRRRGEFILVKEPYDFSVQKRAAWRYLPGQRRVRRAPDLGYDTPNPSCAGYCNYDDVYLFSGQIDRWDMKLIGKKEMFIPYNCYMTEAATQKELLTALHPNPEKIRWELHRVWVVEASLKEGKRHVYGKQTFYQDEDTWIVLAKEAYDNHNTLWRTGYATSVHFYDIPAYWQRVYFLHDWQVGLYNAIQVTQGFPKALQMDLDESFFSTANMRAIGKR